MKRGVIRPNVFLVSALCEDGQEEGLREGLGCEEGGDLNYNGGTRGGHFQVLI